ncbi:MAG: DUF4369 domain-containing protein [Bacteroides sp.]|jgi:peroxiredoxin|nr:DUF4369 domain-containing protein [Bacteroides sp.]MCI1683770.1 DUF4369 domain-containing protein [Bacteroides sp.]
MKKNYLLYCLLIALSACGKQASEEISLTGKIEGLGNDTIYLFGADRLYEHIDTLVVKKDNFSATLHSDTLVTGLLLFSNGTEYPLFLNKGNKITIKGSANTLSSLQISGNTSNEELTNFNAKLKTTKTPIEKQAEEFIIKHPSSLVGIYLLDKYFVQKAHPDFAQIKKITSHMAGELKDRPYMDELLDYIEEEEKTATGQLIPYFHLKNTKGKDINRTNFRDQCLLIHFWASWDSISRKANGMYRRIYKKEQKNKDVALLGISLDINKEEWEKAIKNDTLKWEQVCDFSGWNADIVKQLAIQTLPANILVSPSGRVEGKDLDEKAIEEKLKEIKQKEKNNKTQVSKSKIKH